MTEKEAIKAIKDNKPTSGYTMLCEALDMAIEALEKQIPKKPHKYIAFDGIERNGCPRCFEERGVNEILYAGQKYCSVCGQNVKGE